MSLVSICIPVYNTAKYIQETIECFLNQTYQNVEIIVQDDCSTDGTWELVNQLYGNNEKIRLYRNEKNLGIGANWNAAYNKVRGKYVIIFNADDIVKYNFIEMGLDEFLKDKNLDLVTFKFDYLIEQNGSILPHIPQLYLKAGLQVDLINIIVESIPFSWDFTIAKKISLEKLKINNQLFLNTQTCDFALWLEVGLKNLNLFYIDTPIGYYRKHNSNNSAIPLAEINSFVKDVKRVYHSKLKKNKYYKNRIRNMRYTLFKYMVKNQSFTSLKLLLKII